MIACVGNDSDDRDGEAPAGTVVVPRRVPVAAGLAPGRPRRPLAQDLDPARESPRSSVAAGVGGGGRKHVVVVMDALKEFSTGPLMWALAHVVDPTCMLTILGVMPWLNLPLSCKTWLDIWALDLLNPSALRSRSEWKQDGKYQKARVVVDLCERHGVVPYMKVAMGHPQRLVVLEHTSSLHATWVVLDRHHRKRSTFYRKRIPCNVVMMNDDGGADMLRGMSMLQSAELATPSASPAAVPPMPEVIICDEWRGILRRQNDAQAGEGSETSGDT